MAGSLAKQQRKELKMMLKNPERMGLAALAAMILSFSCLAGTVTLFEVASADKSAIAMDVRLA